MDLTVKEPERWSVTQLPNVRLGFTIEGCPSQLSLAGHVTDGAFVCFLGRMCNLVQDIISKGEDDSLSSQPQKYINVQHAILKQMELGVLEIFALCDVPKPRVKDGNTLSLYWIFSVTGEIDGNVRDRSMKIKFTDFHMEDVSKVGKIFQATCERTGADKLLYVGPKTEEQKLNNPCNRLINSIETTFNHLLMEAFKAYKL